MSEYLQNALDYLETQRDHRIVRDFENIEVPESEYDKTLLQLGRLYVLSPNTAQNAAELCDQLGSIMYAADRLFSELKQSG